jgi:CelD/BcsL family acetyltransferase involved in cellulose biosynthesis
MNQVRVDVLEGTAPIAEEWDQLADRTDADPFVRPLWFNAWFDAFGDGRGLVVTARRDGRLVAVLPVQERGATLSSPTNWHTARFGLLAERPEDARRLVEWTLRTGKRQVRIDFIDAASPDVRLWQDAAEQRRDHVVIRTLLRSPFLALDGDWERYRSDMSKRRRSELRRRRRRLEECGRVAVEVADGRSGLHALLREGFALEAAGWKGQAGTAIVSQPASRRFYTDLARSAAARGLLRLAFLRVAGRAIAFDYSLEHRGVHYLLKQGNDPQWRRYGPGMLLREEMIRRSFAEGHRTYEFLGSDEPWKLEWTSSCHERVHVEFFDHSVAGNLSWLASAYGRPLARRLRDNAGRLRRPGHDSSRRVGRGRARTPAEISS